MTTSQKNSGNEILNSYYLLLNHTIFLGENYNLRHYDKHPYFKLKDNLIEELNIMPEDYGIDVDGKKMQKLRSCIQDILDVYNRDLEYLFDFASDKKSLNKLVDQAHNNLSELKNKSVQPKNVKNDVIPVLLNVRIYNEVMQLLEQQRIEPKEVLDNRIKWLSKLRYNVIESCFHFDIIESLFNEGGKQYMEYDYNIDNSPVWLKISNGKRKVIGQKRNIMIRYYISLLGEKKIIRDGHQCDLGNLLAHLVEKTYLWLQKKKKESRCEVISFTLEKLNTETDINSYKIELDYETYLRKLRLFYLNNKRKYDTACDYHLHDDKNQTCIKCLIVDEVTRLYDKEKYINIECEQIMQPSNSKLYELLLDFVAEIPDFSDTKYNRLLQQKKINESALKYFGKKEINSYNYEYFIIDYFAKVILDHKDVDYLHHKYFIIHELINFCFNKKYFDKCGRGFMLRLFEMRQPIYLSYYLTNKVKGVNEKFKEVSTIYIPFIVNIYRRLSEVVDIYNREKLVERLYEDFISASIPYNLKKEIEIEKIIYDQECYRKNILEKIERKEYINECNEQIIKYYKNNVLTLYPLAKGYKKTMNLIYSIINNNTY